MESATPDAQCIIEDGERNFFLCPASLRENAKQYFETSNEMLSEPDYTSAPPRLLATPESPKLFFAVLLACHLGCQIVRAYIGAASVFPLYYQWQLPDLLNQAICLSN